MGAFELETMKAHQMFASLTPELATRILEDVFLQQKELYKTVLQAAAQSLRVRPVFLERQPRPERRRRLAAALGRSDLNAVASNLIGGWLIKTQCALLSEFLDALKIAHDKGVVENLPKSVDEGSLNAAVENLLAKYPQEIVTLYLHAFCEMNDVQWPPLALLLRDDIRLQLPMLV